MLKTLTIVTLLVFTLGCDPHWGPLGHALVADALAMFSVAANPGTN